MTTGSSARWLGADRAEMAADHILDAAGELFSERGVTSVSMRDVAERAGCSRATLYRYFPGRDDLHLAYVARAAGILAERIDDVVRGPADASTTPADEPVS